MAGQGDFPFRSTWLRGRGRNKGAQPRQIVGVAVDPAYEAVWTGWFFDGIPPQALVAAVVVNSSSFFAAAVTANYSLQPSLVPNSQSYPAVTVTATYTIAPGLIPGSGAFPTVTVSSSYAVIASLFGSQIDIYNAAATQGPARAVTTAQFNENWSKPFFGRRVARG